MNWYNYKDNWINLAFVRSIQLKSFKVTGENQMLWCISFDNNERGEWFVFDSQEERDAEFEKIKERMGIKDYQSRCC
jgi:hypothetical protein